MHDYFIQFIVSHNRLRTICCRIEIQKLPAILGNANKKYDIISCFILIMNET